MTQPNSTSDSFATNPNGMPDENSANAANIPLYQQMPAMQQAPYGSYPQDDTTAYAMPGQYAPQMYGAPSYQQYDPQAQMADQGQYGGQQQPYQPAPAVQPAAQSAIQAGDQAQIPTGVVPQHFMTYEQYQQYIQQQYMPQQAYAQEPYYQGAYDPAAAAQNAAAYQGQQPAQYQQQFPQFQPQQFAQQQPVQYQYPQGYQYQQVAMPYGTQGAYYAQQQAYPGQFAYGQPAFQQQPEAQQMQAVGVAQDAQPSVIPSVEQAPTDDVRAADTPIAEPLSFTDSLPKAAFGSNDPASFDATAIDEEPEDDDDEYVSTSLNGISYMQNRELSWLTFNERVLDQGADESVPLLERLNFISIFWSNLQEFFMVRVGSLTDLTFIDPPVVDSKTGMTAEEQIKAIHERCRELYPIQESNYEHVRGSLAKHGVRHLRPDDLSEEQKNYLSGYVKYNIEPFLSPQIINPQHPFPHLENGKLYILVRLDDGMQPSEEKKKKKGKKGKKADKEKESIENVVLGLIPLPHQCDRIIKLPGRGYQFILLEHAIELFTADIFSMYKIKHTNVICVTRNADIDANQTGDEQDEDYREHMKRLLKKRARLAPVRLECERPMQPVVLKYMLKRLKLKRSQVYDTIVPLDLSFTWGLGSRLTDKKREQLTNAPFTPAWPTSFKRKGRIMDQIGERDVLLSYPYESMDPFVQLLKEAAFDPDVISIKITLYRLASQSQLAEALITAAENGKEVTALFELRARFDESNNIEWSQRFEQAGCNVIYGFRDYKVHSKICCIARKTPEGIRHITQLGTGNYNEKTAKLYTDFSYITTNEAFGRDAVRFFRNMQLEHVSDEYEVLRVAPLQIKPMILENLDRQIELARQGKPCGAFLKANSVTDKDVIEKIAEASQAGVGITLFVRGICCLVPEVKGATENVRVVSIVGRLLEHSRIYCFGTPDDCTMYLSSADLMTRNLNKRVEIAWPILSEDIRWRVLDYIDICLHDTAKLRELRPNKTYTPLGAFYDLDEEGNSKPAFDAQAALIERAAEAAREQEEALEKDEQSQLYEQSTDVSAEQLEEELVASAPVVEAEPASEPDALIPPDRTAEIPVITETGHVQPAQAQENLAEMPLEDLLGQAAAVPFSQAEGNQAAPEPPVAEAPVVEQLPTQYQPAEAGMADEPSLTDMSIEDILPDADALATESQQTAVQEPAAQETPLSEAMGVAQPAADVEQSGGGTTLGEKEPNFFGDKSREIEMPPEKKGFFRRRKK